MNLDIYQLSKLVSKQKVKAIGLFKDNKINTETKYLYLFEGILDNKINNDAEAKRELNYSENSKSFLKFKERYTKKILDYILLSETTINTGEFINEEYCRLLQLYSAAKIIQYKQQSNNSIKLYLYVFQYAKKYEFLDLQLFTGIQIKSHYAFVEPNKKKFIYYTEEFNRIKNTMNKSLELDKFYDDISHQNIMIKQDQMKEFKKQTMIGSQELVKKIEDNDPYLYKSKVYEIAAYAYTINDELEKSIQISKTSIQLSNEKEHVPSFKLYGTYKDIMSNYLKLMDFENAKLYLSKILDISVTHSHNYFRMKSLEFSLYAFSKDYENLFKTTVDVLSSKRLKDYKIHLEEWRLREAFANILLESGNVDKKVTQLPGYKNFKLNKFLNEVDMFSKDKRGTNISILIVELIHFLLRKQYDKILDRLDALNQYTYRYLRNDNTLRSNCFIKMLLKLPEAEYHPLRTERYVKKYEAKLEENPFQISLKSIDVEIIPYEQLWEIIIEILDNNMNKKKIEN